LASAFGSQAMNASTSADDAELIAAFEIGTLPPEAWDHRAHVRVGFIYARQYDLDEAVARMRTGLHALNTAHAVPEAKDRGYHETITVAFMRLIRDASRNESVVSSAEFCDRHPELMKKDALLRYYSRERLVSWSAKTAFVEPDLEPLPG